MHELESSSLLLGSMIKFMEMWVNDTFGLYALPIFLIASPYSFWGQSHPCTLPILLNFLLCITLYIWDADTHVHDVLWKDEINKIKEVPGPY